MLFIQSTLGAAVAPHFPSWTRRRANVGTTQPLAPSGGDQGAASSERGKALATFLARRSVGRQAKCFGPG